MRRFFINLLLSVSFFVSADQMRTPALHETGLLIPDSAIAISQSDFDSGPFRITESGYYYFTENVSFDPIPEQEALRTDRPQTGAWFTGIAIECDNVIIDLNTKTFNVSEDFLNRHDFKVFSMIELNNSPFDHMIFAFKGETELKVANNVVIKNGTLGRNPHHGIHGNNNSNVQLHDLVIKDWEVAPISLNAVESVVIKNVMISGVEHVIPFTGKRALMQSAAVTLQQLIDGGDTDAQPYLDELNVLIADDEQNGADRPSGTHDANAYGLFINRKIDVGPISTEYEEQHSSTVWIENVTVSNIVSEIIETVGIANNGERLKAALFGVLRWEDAYQEGVFAPNAILKAQVYGGHAMNPDAYPEGFAVNILSETPNEALFVSHVQPIFNGDFAGHTNKGVFGMRVDCGRGVTIKNCEIVGVENKGSLGLTLADIPGGEHYSFEQERYSGNDVYGISFAACRDCVIDDCHVIECISDNGDVSGVMIAHESQANMIQNTMSIGHKTHGNVLNSVVNTTPRVYGYRIFNGPQATRVSNCVAQALSAPRYVYGFYTGKTVDAVVLSCISSSHEVTDSTNLDEKKEAIGFHAFDTEITRFEDCVACNIRAQGEGDDDSSSSHVAGFAIHQEKAGNEDHYSSILNCRSEAHNGGRGKSFGVYLYDANYATVRGCTTINNFGRKGFGIYKTKSGDRALVVGNLAYGNKTDDYRVKRTDWPILELSSEDVKDSQIHNPWYNIRFKLER